MQKKALLDVFCRGAHLFDTLNALEDAWVLLRRKLKGTQRITKTLIVEKAIEIALDDLESKSELSELYHRICE